MNLERAKQLLEGLPVNLERAQQSLWCKLEHVQSRDEYLAMHKTLTFKELLVLGCLIVAGVPNE